MKVNKDLSLASKSVTKYLIDYSFINKINDEYRYLETTEDKRLEFAKQQFIQLLIKAGASNDYLKYDSVKRVMSSKSFDEMITNIEQIIANGKNYSMEV